jgi:hypothetical protein
MRALSSSETDLTRISNDYGVDDGARVKRRQGGNGKLMIDTHVSAGRLELFSPELLRHQDFVVVATALLEPANSSECSMNRIARCASTMLMHPFTMAQVIVRKIWRRD